MFSHFLASDADTAFRIRRHYIRRSVSGVKRRADVFDKPSALADLRFVESLGPDFSIRVLHSGEGTLWTDLKSPTLTIPAK